jgi:hypothetical protein
MTGERLLRGSLEVVPRAQTFLEGNREVGEVCVPGLAEHLLVRGEDLCKGKRKEKGPT